MVVKLNGTNYNCPVCHEERTIGEYQRVTEHWDQSRDVADRDYFKLFCLLTNTDYKSFHATSENEVTIWNAIKWFIEMPFPVRGVPKALKVGDKILLIPKKIESLSIGANIHLRQIADKSNRLVNDKGEVLEYTCYSMAVAIFLQPIYDERPFDFDRAQELEKLILDMPAYLIRPIGFFLLANASKSGASSAKHWRQFLNILNIRRWKLWPKLRGSGHYKDMMTYT